MEKIGLYSTRSNRTISELIFGIIFRNNNNFIKLFMQLLVGLGNPGDKYRNTRHNLGFLVLENLSRSFRFEKKYNAEFAKVTIDNKSLPCLKPQTYMNRSGESVAPYINFYQLDPKQCLVIHDELDLPFGEVRLKFGGGEGGHNGLKSISESLGTKDYPRLRLGIGKPEAGNQIPIEDWVLSRFREAELPALQDVMTRAEQAIKAILEFGFPKAQSLVNRTPTL